MKKTLLALLISCMCFSFTSCDEDDIKELLPSFNVDITETENILVAIDQTNGERASYSEKTDLTIVNNDTEDYLNKIKSIEIKSLSYKIINFNGDPTGDVAGSFSVDGQVSLQNDFVVKKVADDQMVYNITEVNELNRIANALKSGKSVEVEYSGSALCDGGDMNFTVEVSFAAKVTIDP